MSELNYQISQNSNIQRYINTDDIIVPFTYKIEAVVTGIDTPISIDFTKNGDMLIADAGILSGNPKVLLLRNGQFEILADGFNVPITGITYRNGDVYVSHRGSITIINLNGNKSEIIKGLPSFGDYTNNKVTFGPDGNMYFGQGTATNSGVVGLDNEWVYEYSFFHDYPGSYIMLNGINYITPNMLIPAEAETYTGAFSPFSGPNFQRYEIIKGSIRASGSVLKANPDGSGIELVAWGFRNPVAVKFDKYNRLFVTNQSYDIRGSRPIANAPDELQIIIPGTWYGWPDYAGGELITLPKYAPQGASQPALLFTNHPSVPPKPFSIFPPYSKVMGFDFNYNPDFGNEGDLYISSFGNTERNNMTERQLPSTGQKVYKVDMSTGEVVTFAMNKSALPAYYDPDEIPQNGGFARPSDIVFGPDGAMYVTEFAISTQEQPYVYLPYTGVIWKISKK
jgi:glucose/arabinose dehydrogenase